MSSNQIRIVSDGSGPDTVVYDSAGHKIDRVVQADIILRSDSVNMVRLEITATSVDIHADLHYIDFRCPACNNLQRHHCDKLGVAE